MPVTDIAPDRVTTVFGSYIAHQADLNKEEYTELDISKRDLDSAHSHAPHQSHKTGHCALVLSQEVLTCEY